MGKGPGSWSSCPTCGQKYGSASYAQHVARCRERKSIANEAALRGVENYSHPAPLPDWEACPKCGYQYGKMAFPHHVAKCRGLLHAHLRKPGFKPDPQLVATAKAAANAIDVEDDVQKQLKRHSSSYDRAYELFKRFDVDGDEHLSKAELDNLLRQCFPARCADAESLSNEFAAADKDGSGLISFDEFVEYYNTLKGSSHDFDEAADMFRFFDKDQSGVLEREEFQALLNNVFPEHCDENEAHLEDEFSRADRDASAGVSFGEFCDYYDHLKALYESYGDEGMYNIDDTDASMARE